MPKSTTAPFPGRILACAAVLGGLALNSGAFAQMNPPAPPPPSTQGPPVNPMYARLEAQLATIDHGRGSGEPSKVDQIRRYQDAQTQQQAELVRVTQEVQR